MLAGGPIFAGLLPMNIVQGDSGEWFVIYQYDIHMNACRIEAISIGRFFENEEYRIGFTYHQLLYILQLTWAIGPFPPQLKCPNFGPVNSEVGGINSKRILNGFWGGGLGSSMNWPSSSLQPMVFLASRSPRNVRNMGWNADLCTGCPRATCERCRWCCITTHTYPDNPLPLAPRCWKFCPISIITLHTCSTICWSSLHPYEAFNLSQHVSQVASDAS